MCFLRKQLIIDCTLGYSHAQLLSGWYNFVVGISLQLAALFNLFKPIASLLEFLCFSQFHHELSCLILCLEVSGYSLALLDCLNYMHIFYQIYLSRAEGEASLKMTGEVCNSTRRIPPKMLNDSIKLNPDSFFQGCLIKSKTPADWRCKLIFVLFQGCSTIKCIFSSISQFFWDILSLKSCLCFSFSRFILYSNFLVFSYTLMEWSFQFLESTQITIVMHQIHTIHKLQCKFTLLGPLLLISLSRVSAYALLPHALLNHFLLHIALGSPVIHQPLPPLLSVLTRLPEGCGILGGLERSEGAGRAPDQFLGLVILCEQSSLFFAVFRF